MNLASDRSNDGQRLNAVERDFVRVLKIAIRAKNQADGTSTDKAGIIADTLLLRNILTATTIHQVLHPANVDGVPSLTFPDFPSVAVLARTILESYLAMHCIAVRSYSVAEREVRLLWWDWHEINERIRTRDTINSKRKEAIEFDKRKAELTTSIRSHAAYGKIPKRLREGFANGEPPKKSLFESNAVIAGHAGIRPEHFDVQYQFLSSVAHSQPTIVRTLRKHDPNAPEAIILLIEALQYSAAYLAFTVRDFAELCPRAKSALDAEFNKFAALWAGVFATPFPKN